MARVSTVMHDLGICCHEHGYASYSGVALVLLRRLDALFRAWAGEWSAEEHVFPPFLPAAELDKVDYFRSFPQLATFPVSLAPDEQNLAAFAETACSRDGALTLGRLQPVREVLTPAACYHFYVRLQGRTLERPVYLTTCATCFRSEREYTALERQWSFSMREIVCIGGFEDVVAFLDAAKARLVEFAARYALPAALELATDPFFGGERHPKYVAQKLAPTKLELLFQRRLAIASVNVHRNFFGERFDIAYAGSPAYSGCVAFGLDRWIAAILATYGDDPGAWPEPFRADLERPC